MKNWWRLYESPWTPNVAHHIRNNVTNSPGYVQCRRKDICQKFSVFYILNIVISFCSSVQSRNIPNCLLNLINHLSWCYSLIHLLWNQPLSIPSPCPLSSRKVILNLGRSCFFSIQRETKINLKMLLDFSLHSAAWVHHLVQRN